MVISNDAGGGGCSILFTLIAIKSTDQEGDFCLISGINRRRLFPFEVILLGMNTYSTTMLVVCKIKIILLNYSVVENDI